MKWGQNEIYLACSCDFVWRGAGAQEALNCRTQTLDDPIFLGELILKFKKMF